MNGKYVCWFPFEHVCLGYLARRNERDVVTRKRRPSCFGDFCEGSVILTQRPRVCPLFVLRPGAYAHGRTDAHALGRSISLNGRVVNNGANLLFSSPRRTIAGCRRSRSRGHRGQIIIIVACFVHRAYTFCLIGRSMDVDNHLLLPRAFVVRRGLSPSVCRLIFQRVRRREKDIYIYMGGRVYARVITRSRTDDTYNVHSGMGEGVFVRFRKTNFGFFHFKIETKITRNRAFRESARPAPSTRMEIRNNPTIRLLGISAATTFIQQPTPTTVLVRKIYNTPLRAYIIITPVHLYSYRERVFVKDLPGQ